MAKGDDIAERLIDFAVRIVTVCANLPKTQAGIHLAEHRQLPTMLKPEEPRAPRISFIN